LIPQTTSPIKLSKSIDKKLTKCFTVGRYREDRYSAQIDLADLEIMNLGANPAPIEEALPVFRKVKQLRAILEFNALTACV